MQNLGFKRKYMSYTIPEWVVRKTLHFLCCTVSDLADSNDWGSEFFLDDLQVFPAFALFSPWPHFFVIFTFDFGTTFELPSSKPNNISSK